MLKRTRLKLEKLWLGWERSRTELELAAANEQQLDKRLRPYDLRIAEIDRELAQP